MAAACSEVGCDGSAKSRGLCKKHYRAVWYQENRERILAQTRAYQIENAAALAQAAKERYARNREARLAAEAERYRTEPEFRERKLSASRDWYARNRDQKSQAASERYERNRERYSATQRAYYLANRERSRLATERWITAHPDRYSLIQRTAKHRRRALERNGRVTRTDLAAILAEHGMVCHICGGDIESLADLHFDHVIPLSKGGPHEPANIRPSHAACNQRKAARLTA